jgi:uncharacterized short protein YbdD (DUF466 family)
MAAAATLAAGARAFTAFVQGVLGEDAYRKYLQHREATHCDEPVLTEREFWRDRMDRQDANPQSRCC